MKLDKPIVIVFNPKGGSANPTTLEQLKQALQTLFSVPVFTLATSRDPYQTVADIRKMQSGSDLYKLGVGLFIAMGGDGTARVVAEAVGNSTPMSVFPGGTGNLFARTFYSYPTVKTFARTIANGLPQPVDLLEASYTPTGETQAQKKLVLVALGLGRLSDAIADADPTWKRWVGSLAYATGMVRASFDPDENKVSFRDLDGNSLGSGFTDTPISAAFLLNVAPPQLINISRGCNASDNRLDLVCFQANNFSELCNAAAWTGIGKPERSHYYARRRVPGVVITSVKPMKLNLDGDSGGLTTEVSVKTLPGAVQMILA